MKIGGKGMEKCHCYTVERKPHNLNANLLQDLMLCNVYLACEEQQAHLWGLHNSNVIASVHPRQCSSEEVAVSRLISIKHRDHFHLRRSGILAVDLLQTAVQVGGLRVGLVLALVPIHPDDRDAVNLVQLLGQLLTKVTGQE